MGLPGYIEFDLAAKLLTTLFPTEKVVDGCDQRMIAITESFRAVIQEIEKPLQKESVRQWDEVHRDLAAAYLEILGPEITARREKQDENHGVPDHDDTHVPHDWIRFIREYVDGAEWNIRRIEPDEYETHLIDVAALCIAAIQSNRRKLNRSTPPELRRKGTGQ
jgi:hypothetical protein